jgi:hypothetical protein
VGNALKKCGFADWCSECDAALWATNPDAVNDDQDDDVDDDDVVQSIVEVGYARPWPLDARVERIIYTDDDDDDDDNDSDDDVV